jgi:hypothetical protein
MCWVTPTTAATLGANCNCYCCSSGDKCSPVHVGTISLGNPGNSSATCDLCTEEACLAAYPDHCVPDVPYPDGSFQGQTIASCDSGDIVDGDPCGNADSCAFTEIGTVDAQGNLITAQYDLSGLCRAQGYDYKLDTLSTEWYNINICGYAPKQCFPADCANDAVNGRNWKGGPCTPWVATANLGSVVRFFESDIDPPPTTGTSGSTKSPDKPPIQRSCYTDDGQPVQCTEACTILSTSIIGADGVNVNWGWSNSSNDASGITALGPATAISLDPSNPMGAFGPSQQPICQPTSEFNNGVESAKIVFLCDPSKGKNEAEILKVDMMGCDYTITFLTGAVCDPTCPPNTGKCTSGPNKGFCMEICATHGMGWFGTLLVVFVVLFSTYCIAGALYNKTKIGVCRIPHGDFWVSCMRCECLQSSGSSGDSYKSTFGGNVNNNNSAGNYFNKATANPDMRRASGGGGGGYGTV